MKDVFKIQAEVCKALSNPKRLEIIYALKGGELTVGEIVARVGLPKANVSQHLGVLRSACVLKSRRQGTSVHYRIANSKIVKACALMREVLIEELEAGKKMLKGLKSA